jgi:hypothetical protein
MGLLNDLHELKVRGAEVLIEARSNLFFTEYCLIVDGVKQDQIRGLFGTFYLHGRIQDDPLRVKIKQGFGGTKYKIKFQGEVMTPLKVH